VTEPLLIVGGSLFAIFGLLHAVYTLADTYRPRRLVPDDPALIEAMSSTGVRLARGGTTMWKAWLGFNFSHSLGAVLFGSLCIALGVFLKSLALPKAVLVLPVLVSAIYLLLAVRYWFRVPIIGIAIGTLCLFFGWVAY